jgi:XRE family aerobic/anaerobic benzoate catabolism transcriptional regulator
MKDPCSPLRQRRVLDEERLLALAERVRHLRALRGMTRSMLSEHSGVSVPHVARLEAGRFNVSVLVLDRLARALGVPLESMLADVAAPATAGHVPQPNFSQAACRRIALLGIRGAGKSTVGEALARRLGFPLVECGQQVADLAGMPASAVLLQQGQAAYRRHERQVVGQVVQQPAVVLCTSGGVVSEPASYALLQQHCFTVWLHARPEVYFARSHRLNDTRIASASLRRHALDTIRRTMEARLPLYAAAAMSIDTSELSVDAVVRQIMEELGHVAPSRSPAPAPLTGPGAAAALHCP